MHEDLLEQAVRLAELDAKKPKYLQEWRHCADYDLTERFKRSDVLSLIKEIERRIQAFGQLASSNEKRFFLACLWAWKELANR